MTEVSPQRSEKSDAGVCVLASGGADSCVLIHELVSRFDRVLPLYVRTGLVWEGAELYWLRRFLKATARPSIRPLEVLDLPVRDLYRDHWSVTGKAVPNESSGWEEVYLPGRNLILLAKTAVFCSMQRIGAIAMGPLKTNRFADSSLEFLSQYGVMAHRALGFRLEILAPFFNLTKEDVLARGKTLPLELTFSCLNPRGVDHCGVCNKCAERSAAFSGAHMDDPTFYRREVGETRHSRSG